MQDTGDIHVYDTNDEATRRFKENDEKKRKIVERR